MIAEGFLHFGAKVYIVARREEILKKTQEKLSKIGLCEYIVADLGSVNGVETLAKIFCEREQSLDILVNNAGISDGGIEIENITEETWDSVMDLNIKIIFFMIQKFLPLLRVGSSPETPKNVIIFSFRSDKSKAFFINSNAKSGILSFILTPFSL